MLFLGQECVDTAKNQGVSWGSVVDPSTWGKEAKILKEALCQR